MTKLIVLVGMMFLSCFTANCQDLPKIVPPSPLAAAFARYGEIPVDYSTGVPNIAVPIYNIKCGSLELPINISYHGSGIKVQDIASPVGLGWVLNAGGVISRSILGLEDEANAVSSIPFKKVEQIELARTQATNDLLKTDLGIQLADMANGTYDLQADRYTYNFNNHAGVFRKNFINNQFVQIPYSPIKITKYTTNGTYFEVIDENGIKYEFKASESTIDSYGGTGSGVTSWWLTKMTSANNEDVIEFIYKAGDQLASRGYSETFEIGGKTWWEMVGEQQPFMNLVRYESSDAQYNKQKLISYTNTQILDKIICRTATIKFNYLSDRIDPATTRIQSLDILQTATNQTIKTVKFNQSYFGNSTYNNFRLRLDSLTIKGANLSGDGEKYQFSYNTDVVLPNYYTLNTLDEVFHEDYWGYYNGSDNTSQIPNEFAVQDIYYNNYSFTIPSGNRNLNNNFIQACMLKDITYPTGGKTTFEFESNEGFAYDYTLSNHQGGGLRIKSIKSYDAPNHLAGKRSYTYAPYGVKDVTKSMFKFIKKVTFTEYDYFIPGSNMSINIPGIFDFDHDFFSSSSLFSMQGGNGSAVYYFRVTEKQESELSDNGYTEYEYDHDYLSDSYHQLPLLNNEPRLCAAYHFDHGFNKPLLVSKVDYKKDGAGYASVKSLYNTYTKYKSEPFNTGIKVDRSRYYMTPYMGAKPEEISPYDNIWEGFIFTDTKGYEEVKLLTQADVYQNGMHNRINYVYNNLAHLQPTSDIVTTSKGDVLKTEYKYPSDFSSQTPYNTMISKNILIPVIEKLRYKNNNLLEGTKRNYNYWYNTWGVNNSESIIVPQTVDVKLAGSYETRLRYNAYDNKRNVLSVSKENNTQISYLWDYNQTVPIAEVTNASNNEIFFESFEDKLGWGGTTEVPQAVDAYDNNKSHSGRIAARIDNSTATERVAHYQKVFAISLSVPKKFRYSGWVYSNGPSADIYLFMKRAGEGGYYSYVDHITTSEINKWVFLEKDFEVPADVTQLGIRIDNNGGNGSVWFDDIRLHPSDAQMVTYTYDPLVGMTSQTDVNNRSTYYEYDSFNRLKLIKDKDGNILKRICYNYAGQPDACGSAIYAKLTLANQHSVTTGGTIFTKITTTYADIVVSFYSDAGGTSPVNVANFPITILNTKSIPPVIAGPPPTVVQSTASYTCTGNSYTLPGQTISYLGIIPTNNGEAFSSVFTLTNPVGYTIIN
jgi:hypothetical protein